MKEVHESGTAQRGNYSLAVWRAIFVRIDRVPASASLSALVLIFYIGLMAAPSLAAGTNYPTSRSDRNTTTPIRLAIVGFSVPADGAQTKSQNTLLTDLLNARLTQSGRLELVERQEIDALTHEMSLSLSQALKPADAIHIGKMLRADWLLMGSILVRGDTNTVIAKIVDARTGIILDLTAVPLNNKKPDDAVASIATFVVNDTEPALQHERRVFFGIGGFEDLSVNNRYPDFRKNLVASLEQHFRGTPYSVVERSMVDPLLAELRLNRAGLTAGAASDTEAQPAILLVDGVYQSYQDENAKVNLILSLQEIGGGRRLHSFNEPPGAALDKKIEDVLSSALGELKPGGVPQNRKEEAAVQLAHGLQRVGVALGSTNIPAFGGYWMLSELDKQPQNLQEAKQAFEAAVLLDPDNAEAKFYLGGCLLRPEIGENEAGRNYLREVIATAKDDLLVRRARSGLAWSYLDENARQALDLLVPLERDTADLNERAGVDGGIKQALFELDRRSEISKEEYRKLAENLVFTQCEILQSTNCHSMIPILPFEFWRELSKVPLRETQASADTYFEQFLPQLTEKFPRLAPYIWTTYVGHRYGDFTNLNLSERPGVLEGLCASLEICRDHPEKVRSFYFWQNYDPVLLIWSVCHEQYKIAHLAAQIAEQPIPRDPRERILPMAFSLGPQPATKDVMTAYCLGYAYRGVGKWQAAQAAFEHAGKLSESILMGSPGPWGTNVTRVYAQDLIAECQQHLTPTAIVKLEKSAHRRPGPTTFTLGEPVIKVGRFTVFSCDGDLIWLTDGFAPFVYDQRNRLLVDIEWPTNVEHTVSCILHDDKTVWWGTLGSGLVEMDKQSKRCRVYTEKDGLLLNQITALALDHDRLWVGFSRHGHAGGLGYLDINSHRWVGMTPEITPQMITNGYFDPKLIESKPPGGAVLDLTFSSECGLLALSTDFQGLKQYSVARNKWHTLDITTPTVNCAVAYSNYVATGGQEGLIIHNMSNQHETRVTFPDWFIVPAIGVGVPGVNSLAVKNGKIWEAGDGFLALVDMKSGEVEQICAFVSNNWMCRPKQLEIDGDKLWVGIENRIYQLPAEGFPSRLATIK